MWDGSAVSEELQDDVYTLQNKKDTYRWEDEENKLSNQSWTEI